MVAIDKTTPGEFLQAVMIHGLTGERTGPLRFQAAAGSDEHGTHSQPYGGFLVPPAVARDWFLTARTGGKILSRVRWDTDSLVNQGEAILPTTDETSRVDGSRHGGVVATWRKETTAATASRATVKLERYPANQLMGFVYVSEESMRSLLMGDFVADVFTDEIRFMLERAILWGVAGQVGGILADDSIIDTEKESGQGAGTINATNLRRMISRLPAQSRDRAAFFVSEDLDAAILDEEISGGFQNLVQYETLPDGTVQKLLCGYPRHVVEYGSVLGTRGDSVLADFGQYQLVTDGERPKSDVSMDLRFLEHERAFRFVLHAAGRSLWRVPKTPFNGTVTKSPFGVLATRA